MLSPKHHVLGLTKQSQYDPKWMCPKTVCIAQKTAFLGKSRTSIGIGDTFCFSEKARAGSLLGRNIEVQELRGGCGEIRAAGPS
jgi:hypothetical protein